MVQSSRLARGFALVALTAAIPVTNCLVLSDARAATRYAIPTGGASSGQCTEGDPCTLPFAVSGASVGDRIQLRPEVYTLTQPLTVNADSLLFTTPLVYQSVNGPMPEIRFLTESQGGAGDGQSKFITLANGTNLSHVKVTGRVDGSAVLVGDGLGQDGFVHVSKSIISATGSGTAIKLARGYTALSVVRQQGSGVAVAMSGGNIQTSTIYSDSGTALVVSNPHSLPVACEPTIRGALIRGAARNLEISGGVGPCTVRYSYSWIPSNSFGGGISYSPPSQVVDEGGNLPSNSEVFPVGDYLTNGFILQPGNPAIDALPGPIESAADLWERGANGPALDIGPVEAPSAPNVGSCRLYFATPVSQQIICRVATGGIETRVTPQFRKAGSSEWGNGDALTITQTPGGPGSEQSVLLMPLTPQTAYEARVRADNALGSSTGEVPSFSTPASNPTPPRPSPKGPERPAGKFSVKGKRVSVIIKPTPGVRYAIGAERASKASIAGIAKSTRGRCKANKKTKKVECAIKLSRGRWKVSITPSKSGVAGPPLTKSVNVR